MGWESNTGNKSKDQSSGDCKSDPECKLDGKADTDRLWNGRCDRWHRKDCVPWPDPSPSPAPDYVSANVCYLIVCGQVVRDYYNNWYVGIGGGISPGLSLSGNAGWLFQAGRSEEAIQKFMLGWSAFGGGTLPIGVGGAGTWGDPSLTHPFDIHDVAGEVQVGNPGGAAGLLYDFWIYDSGDPTPWFWQDKDGKNNIKLQR
jgi:hypothetical protein